ncbi:MAG: PilW family protein [Candidatus Berkiella sp.]
MHLKCLVNKLLVGKCEGYTITEMLIGLSLGALLTTSVIHIFLSIKQTTSYQQGISRIQENMQVSSILLGQWFRGAGDYGCNRLDADRALRWVGIKESDIEFNRVHPVYPTTIEKLRRNSKISAATLARIKENTDIILMHRIRQFYTLSDYEDAQDGKVSVLGQPSYNKDDVVFLTDCQSIDVFKVAKDVNAHAQQRTTNIHIHLGNQSSLSKLYPPSARLGKLESELIYIGDTARKNQKGNPIFALYATDLNGRTLELVEGAEEMSVEFCCAPETKQYYPQAMWKPEHKINAVRISLLLSSVEDAQSIPTMYKHKDIDVMPKDKLIRKWWTQEWAIRSAA